MYVNTAYEVVAEQLSRREVNLTRVVSALKGQQIETPSWGYGDSGTRFKVFPWPGAARDIHEKLADAAQVHRYTGIASSVAVHIPWDQVDDFRELRTYAVELGLTIGAVNPNVFQDDAYRLGSVCHPDPAVRQRSVEHLLECVAIMRDVGSSVLSLWLADGTNYAGQDDLRARKRRLTDALAHVYDRLPDGARLLIEYKFFEPAFYHTDLADWGMAYAVCRALGPKAQVLVDTGHHAQGTNIAHIVAILLDEGVLGGFHFNDRRYADDDLIVGTVNPFELFLIYNEIVAAEMDDDPTVSGGARRVAYMIDQSHNIEAKIEAMIVSVLNCQAAYAKALLVDRARLAEYQSAGDVLGAHRVLADAFQTDVRPRLTEVRREMGLDPDPIAAFRASGYAERMAAERVRTRPSGSGYSGG